MFVSCLSLLRIRFRDRADVIRSRSGQCSGQALIETETDLRDFGLGAAALLAQNFKLKKTLSVPVGPEIRRREMPQ
jgi:hypothetical protein